MINHWPNMDTHCSSETICTTRGFPAEFLWYQAITSLELRHISCGQPHFWEARQYERNELKHMLTPLLRYQC